jgi:hypothetical protein
MFYLKQITTAIVLIVQFGLMRESYAGKEWPPSIRGVVQTFRIENDSETVFVDGVMPNSSVREGFSFYEFLKPTETPSWKDNASCRFGVIHTYSTVSDEDQKVKIAVPIKLCLKSNPTDHDEALNTQFLTASVLTLNSENADFSPVEGSTPTCYSLRYFYESAGSPIATGPGNSLEFNFEDIVLSDAVTIARETEYSIEIRWCGRAIKNVNEIEFGIGDQIRLLEDNSN